MLSVLLHGLILFALARATPASRAGLQHDDTVLNPGVWQKSHRKGES
jgi:hypothetical protein